MANEILRLRAAPSLSRDGLDWERADEVLSSAIKCLSSEWGPSWNTPDGIAVLEALRAKVREAGTGDEDDL
jgi:hypothetical protein